MLYGKVNRFKSQHANIKYMSATEVYVNGDQLKLLINILDHIHLYLCSRYFTTHPYFACIQIKHEIIRAGNYVTKNYLNNIILYFILIENKIFLVTVLTKNQRTKNKLNGTLKQ